MPSRAQTLFNSGDSAFQMSPAPAASIGQRMQRMGIITDWQDALSSSTGELTVVWDSPNNRFVGYVSKVATLDIAHGTSTDGLNWTVTATSVVGSGFGEESGDAVRPFIYQESGTQYLFYSDYSVVPGGQLKVRTATNWITFTAPDTTTQEGNPSSDGVLFEITDPDRRWANCRVMKDGATYRMLLEYSDDSTSHTVYATASNILGPWTLQNSGNRLYKASIDQIENYDGSVSPGTFFKVGAEWLWFNWQWSSTEGDNHTRLYFNRSSDLINWNPPRLIRDIEPSDIVNGEELDQFADLNMVEVNGVVYLWSTMVGDGSYPSLHKFNGTVAQLAHIRPNDEYPCVLAYPSVNQTLNVGSNTSLNFGATIKVTHNCFDGTTFTVPVRAAGDYDVSVDGLFIGDGGTNAIHLLVIRGSSVTGYVLTPDVTAGSQYALSIRCKVTSMLEGETLYIRAYQGASTAWVVQGGTSYTGRLSIERIRRPKN